MNIETLKEIVKLAKDEGVAELTVESTNFKVSVNFATAAVPVQHVQPIVHQQVPTAQAVAPKAASDKGLHVIKSPFVGTFYAAPSPGKPAYVKVGDKVKVGQTLCVLEAMKIMNEIEADVAGEVIEICIDNESLVEFGQPLFKIKPN